MTDALIDAAVRKLCQYRGDPETGDCPLASATGCSACAVFEEVLRSLVSSIHQQDAKVVCTWCEAGFPPQRKSYGWIHGEEDCQASPIHELAQSNAPAAGGRS